MRWCWRAHENAPPSPTAKKGHPGSTGQLVGYPSEPPDPAEPVEPDPESFFDSDFDSPVLLAVLLPAEVEAALAGSDLVDVPAPVDDSLASDAVELDGLVVEDDVLDGLVLDVVLDELLADDADEVSESDPLSVLVVLVAGSVADSVAVLDDSGVDVATGVVVASVTGSVAATGVVAASVTGSVAVASAVVAAVFDAVSPTAATSVVVVGARLTSLEAVGSAVTASADTAAAAAGAGAPSAWAMRSRAFNRLAINPPSAKGLNTPGMNWGGYPLRNALVTMAGMLTSALNAPATSPVRAASMTAWPASPNE